MQRCKTVRCINHGSREISPTGILPALLLVKKTQTFQSHQDSQEAVKEEGLLFPIYVAL